MYYVIIRNKNDVFVVYSVCYVYSKGKLRIESERPPELSSPGATIVAAAAAAETTTYNQYDRINEDGRNDEDPHYDTIAGGTALPVVTP